MGHWRIGFDGRVGLGSRDLRTCEALVAARAGNFREHSQTTIRRADSLRGHAAGADPYPSWCFVMAEAFVGKTQHRFSTMCEKDRTSPRHGPERDCEPYDIVLARDCRTSRARGQAATTVVAEPATAGHARRLLCNENSWGGIASSKFPLDVPFDQAGHAAGS